MALSDNVKTQAKAVAEFNCSVNRNYIDGAELNSINSSYTECYSSAIAMAEYMQKEFDEKLRQFVEAARNKSEALGELAEEVLKIS